MTLADYFAANFIKHPPRADDVVPLGPVTLVAHTVTDDRVDHGRPAARRAGAGAAHAARTRSGSELARGCAAGCGRWSAIRAARSVGPCCTSQAPPNSTAGPEQIAEHVSCQERQRQRRSTASGPAMSSAVHAAERPHREIGGGEEDQRAGHASRRDDRQRAAPAARQRCRRAPGSSDRGIDHRATRASHRSRAAASLISMAASGTIERQRPACRSMHAGEQRGGGDRREVRHVRQQARGDVEARSGRRPAARSIQRSARAVFGCIAVGHCAEFHCDAPA